MCTARACSHGLVNRVIMGNKFSSDVKTQVVHPQPEESLRKKEEQLKLKEEELQEREKKIGGSASSTDVLWQDAEQNFKVGHSKG